MSKINPLQAAALSEAVAAKPQATAAKAKKAATVSTKAVPAQKIAVKPTSAKSAPANTAAPKKADDKATPASKPVVKAATVAKTADKKALEKKATVKPVKEKAPKLKMERDSFTMPKTEYAQLYVLKERLIKLGQPSKKSELLRAGVMQLSAMTDAALKAAMGKVPAIKTGRPKKK
jgi:hypothetical protein